MAGVWGKKSVTHEGGARLGKAAGMKGHGDELPLRGTGCHAPANLGGICHGGCQPLPPTCVFRLSNYQLAHVRESAELKEPNPKNCTREPQTLA